MWPVLTREQCRAADRYAIEELGIPGVVLMENAGRNAADHIEGWLRRLARKQTSRDPATGAQVCVVCGKGNNGGDGFVIARHLSNRGYTVAVDLAAEPASLTGDAAINYRIAEQMGIPIHALRDSASLDHASQRWRGAMVIVDALLGTGFAGSVREPLASIIDRINALHADANLEPAAPPEAGPHPLIVAVDVPSGLDADSGDLSGPAVRAHHTITFLAAKTGYTKKTARAYVGRLVVADIGAPTALILERLGITPPR